MSVSSSITEIGCYPQTEGLPDNYTTLWFDSKNSMTHLKSDSLPNFIPNLIWQLKKEAIVTDIISTSNITGKGFLMNNKAKEIFGLHRLINYKFHEVILISKGVEYQYYYLQLVNDNLDMIDFKDSVFCVTNPFRMKEKGIEIQSLSDLRNKLSNLNLGKLISAEKLKLKSSYEYDLFFLPFIHNNFFISESFKKILIDNNITGLHFEEQNILE